MRLAFLLAWVPALALAAHPIVNRGVRAYDGGDYARAIKLLEPALGAGVADLSERTRARTFLAAAHFASGDSAAVDRTLEALFRDDPGARVDSGLFPPPFVQRFEQLKARAAAVPAVAAPPNSPPPPAPVTQVPPPANDAPVPSADVAKKQEEGGGFAPGIYLGGTIDPLWRVFGGEAAVALDLGTHFAVRAGLTLGPMPSLRLSAAWRLAFVERVGLLISGRGMLCPWFPGGVAGGGGLGAHLWIRLFKPLDIVVGGAAEVYGSPSGVVFAPLINLGVEAHLGR